MAYYKDAPVKRKTRTDYASKGSWDEEGTHYRDHQTGNRKSRFSSSGPEKSGRYSSGADRADRFSRGRKPEGTQKGGWNRPERRDEAPRRRVPYDRAPGRNQPERTPEQAASYLDSEYIRENPIPEKAEERDSSNILCGRNPIREALKNERDLEKLLVQKGELSGSAREIVQMAKAAGVMIQEVDKARLDEIVPHHQGLIAFASAYPYSTLEEILLSAREKNEAPFIILLDGITDPHNFGAIIRTAECAGAHGIVIPQHRSVGLTPSAAKASAGAIEYARIAKVKNLNQAIEALKKENIWVYAASMEGRDYETVDFSGGTALVIGAEGAGVSRLTQEKCDMTVSLPIRGQIDSLNASVAAGILMYRVLSSRSAGKKG